MAYQGVANSLASFPLIQGNGMLDMNPNAPGPSSSEDFVLMFQAGSFPQNALRFHIVIFRKHMFPVALEKKSGYKTVSLPFATVQALGNRSTYAADTSLGCQNG